jgi:putative endonuclease
MRKSKDTGIFRIRPKRGECQTASFQAHTMFYVYILTNRKQGTLYTGITNDLAARIALHRNGLGSEFVWKHRLFRLVCVQPFATVVEAIAHEKRLKKWPRHWKIRLIEKDNPDWRDLYDELLS